MKTISAGTLIVNEYNQILVGQVTLQNPVRYDIPKGKIEEQESALQAAIRECKEEFGYDLPSIMVDLGQFVYNGQKNIHLFKLHVKKEDINLDALKCSSYFSLGEREHLEICGYRWYDIAEINDGCFAKSMVKVLNKLVDSGIISKQ